MSVFRSREQKVCLCWASEMMPSWKSIAPPGKALGRIWAKSIGEVSWGQGYFLHARTGLGHFNIFPISFTSWQRKHHPLFALFVIPHAWSYKNILHFKLLFFLCTFLLIIVPFPSVTIQGFVRPPLFTSPINVFSWRLSPTAGWLSFSPIPRSLCFHPFPGVYAFEFLVIVYLFSKPGTPNAPFQSFSCHQSFL